MKRALVWVGWCMAIVGVGDSICCIYRLGKTIHEEIPLGSMGMDIMIVRNDAMPWTVERTTSWGGIDVLDNSKRFNVVLHIYSVIARDSKGQNTNKDTQPQTCAVSRHCASHPRWIHKPRAPGQSMENRAKHASPSVSSTRIY